MKDIIYLLIDGGKDIDKTLFRYSLPYQKNEYEKTHIIYKIWPDTASNKNVVWSSSNEKVAKAFKIGLELKK